MPAKIRLTRQGRKKRPFYHIVVADSRAPRDGNYIDKLGLYDPNTNPATIDLDFEKALDWLQKGAQPTDTCKAILSYKGVLMKKHLLEGVKKGALTEEEANTRFDKWLKEKITKIQAKTEKVKKTKETEAKKRLDAEVKIKDAKAEEIAKKKAAEAKAEAAAAKEAEEPAVEEITEAAVEEAPVEEIVSKEETPAAAEGSSDEQDK
jgi:small subunit ribosomal protein S16